MAATIGRKQLTLEQRQSIFRTKPREVRSYKHGIILQYLPLIDSFTLNDYREYEKLLNLWGTPGRKKEVMLERCIKQKINGLLYELAAIRAEDLLLHQKILSALRHRWTNKLEVEKKKINENTDIFWNQMASSIQRRGTDPKYQLSEEWAGAIGKQALIEFLKSQFDKQNGLCAISKEKLTLEHGTGKRNPTKCSPDRKNSNIGYTPNNVWLVADWVNSMKLDTPLITFWKRIDQLSEARQYNLKYNKNKPRYKNC